jgi:predicted NBD/HSP70 family sugar kinase
MGTVEIQSEATEAQNGQSKLKQKRKLLGLLQRHGISSAPELSKMLKISLPTSISILNDLMLNGYVCNFGTGESSGGRKPNLYGLPEDGFYVAVCDIRRYNSILTICNPYYRFATPVITIDCTIDDPLLVNKIHNSVSGLLKEFQIPEEKLIGIGIDMPGLIDSANGINYTIKDKKHQNVGREIKKRFNKTVYVDNDARMHGYGEIIIGTAKQIKDAVIIHWSWGIGLCIYANGQLYSGKNGFAGEFSHIPMIENGDQCICGKRGCLETVASSNTIMKLVKQGVEENSESTLLNHFKGKADEITPDDVIQWARLGDEFSISILNKVGRAMGRGLSYLIQLLNPEIIVISGPLSKANQYVLSPIQQSINLACLEKISANTNIVISDLGDESAFKGTAAMVYKKAFDEMKL